MERSEGCWGLFRGGGGLNILGFHRSNWTRSRLSLMDRRRRDDRAWLVLSPSAASACAKHSPPQALWRQRGHYAEEHGSCVSILEFWVDLGCCGLEISDHHLGPMLVPFLFAHVPSNSP